MECKHGTDYVRPIGAKGNAAGSDTNGDGKRASGSVSPVGGRDTAKRNVKKVKTAIKSLKINTKGTMGAFGILPEASNAALDIMDKAIDASMKGFILFSQQY